MLINKSFLWIGYRKSEENIFVFTIEIVYSSKIGWEIVQIKYLFKNILIIFSKN